MGHYENQYDDDLKTSTEVDEVIHDFQVSYTQGKIENDPVNNPKHYTNHPSGIECIQVTEHMGFNLGNAMKYIWRCDLKKDAIEDLKKARWYLDREINKRENS